MKQNPITPIIPPDRGDMKPPCGNSLALRGVVAIVQSGDCAALVGVASS